jgi:predicted metalloprotease with PDZ domain
MARQAATPFSVRALVVLTCALVSAPAHAQAREGAFHAEYTVAVKDTAAHLFHVTATFSQLHQPRLDLALPAWTPGWYTIENYAKNVLRFTVTDGAGTRLRAPLSHASTWSIDTRGKDRVTAEFDYSATVSAVNQAKVTSTYAFFTGTQLFLEPVGHRAAPATVRFVVPPGWRIATALRDTPDSTVYTASDYDALVDAPTMLGTFDLYRFDVDGTPHFFVQKSVAPIPVDTVAAATAKFALMVRTARAIFGTLPYEKYLVFSLPDTTESRAIGALEHLNSYVSPEGPMVGLPVPNTHEFFHVWNVKRIRPAEMWPYDYARPNESPSLWASEGFTDYYGPMLWYRSFGGDSVLLRSVDGAVNFIELNEARRYISPSDASISTWLGYDTPVAFSISYYAQGAVLGALLDLSILHDTHGSRGLDDVMRALYRQFYQKGKGFTPDDMRRTVSAVAGRDYADFFRRYVTGVDVPPYDTIFSYAGFERSEVGYLGIFGQSTPLGYRIGGMMRGSAAALAGLKRGDVLVSSDGMPMKQGAAGMGAGAPGQRVNYVVLRDGKELRVAVTLATRRVLRLRSDSSATADQLAVRKRWLARPAPGATPR